VSLSLPEAGRGIVRASIALPGPAGDTPRYVEVMVDPATARVLGQRDSEGHLTAVIYRLHSTLLLPAVRGLPELDAQVVAVTGLVLMASALSGLYLWWPRRRHAAAAVWVHVGKGSKRLVFDLHRAVGFWTAALLLTIAFSGVYLARPGWIRPVVGAVARTEPRPRPESVPGARAVSVARAAAAARAAAPGAVLTALDLPDGPRGVYRAWLRRPGDLRARDGDAIAYIDQWSGALLHLHERRTMPAGEGFLHWQFPLHNGEAFGLPGRLVVLVTGLVPPLLAVTGMLIWHRKRRVAASRARPGSGRGRPGRAPRAR
jgi:uncharacterized iron-regulated membrane protein